MSGRYQCYFKGAVPFNNNHLLLPFLCQADAESTVPLEMRFRPEDRYCKPAVAREEKVTSLVLKVKRRKAKSDDGVGRIDEYSVELLGIANKNYHFPGRYCMNVSS